MVFEDISKCYNQDKLLLLVDNSEMTVEDKLGKDGSNDRTIEEKPIDMPCLYTSLSSTFESSQELKNIIESKTQNLKKKKKIKA